MRLKVYYQPDEVEEYLYTFGNEWMLTDSKQEYKGAYHKYLTGEVYTQSTYNSVLSKPLIPFQPIEEDAFAYSQLRPDIKILSNIRIASHIPIVTPADLKVGYINRYFVQKINETWIIEINQTLYNQLITDGFEAILYRFVAVKWFVSGTLTDINDGNVKTLGVISKNLQQIQNASNVISNISSKLLNPAELYVDTDYVVPVDINGLNS
jgi:hypothetical protein